MVVKRRITQLAVPLSVLLLAGCTEFFEPTPIVTDLEQEKVISNTASLSHTFVRGEKSSYIACTQPPPDAAFSQGQAADVSISLINLGGDDEEGEEEESDELEMAGRTPTVILARELMFRACEFSQNFKLDKKEALALYEKTMAAIEKAWAIEAGNTTVTVGDTVSTTTTSNITATNTGSATSATSATQTDSSTESTTTSSETTESN